MKRISLALVAMTASLAFAAPALANPGDLDASFNGAGFEQDIFEADGFIENARGVTERPDGSILVAGDTIPTGNPATSLNPDSFSYPTVALYAAGGARSSIASARRSMTSSTRPSERSTRRAPRSSRRSRQTSAIRAR